MQYKDLKNELLIEAKNQKYIIPHKGNFRSGGKISSNGDLYIISDVNPRAIVSANNDVYVWGKLLGIALTGQNGNKNGSIASLFMNPLQ